MKNNHFTIHQRSFSRRLSSLSHDPMKTRSNMNKTKSNRQEFFSQTLFPTQEAIVPTVTYNPVYSIQEAFLPKSKFVSRKMLLSDSTKPMIKDVGRLQNFQFQKMKSTQRKRKKIITRKNASNEYISPPIPCNSHKHKKKEYKKTVQNIVLPQKPIIYHNQSAQNMVRTMFNFQSYANQPAIAKYNTTNKQLSSPLKRSVSVTAWEQDETLLDN